MITLQGPLVTRRRVLVALGVLLAAIVAYGVWQTWALYRDLDRAQDSAADLRAAIDSGDPEARDRAIEDLKETAAGAADRADGLWWKALTWVPILGDDADGVRTLSSTLDQVADEGVEPLADTVDRLEQVSKNGSIDLDVVREIQDPVARASDTFGAASREVDALDSSGFTDALRTRYDEYADILGDAAQALASADTAAQALPAMVGADGPRDYFVVFQNNAEVRATGGMPGSWALIHAEDGNLEMRQQGAAIEFPTFDEPVLPLTEGELAVYGKEIGRYFQDPGFAPDFPRAAELWHEHWDRKFPDIPIDGVFALDPVGMSYLVEGTGPIRVGGLTLTADNLVDELLNKPYIERGVAAQDQLFREAARTIFEAMTGDLASPVSFIDGMSRATREGRFLVAPFDDGDAEVLAGSTVLGELPTDDGKTPYVDIGVNDATGSKMSYYLRFRAEIEGRSCADNRQQLAGEMVLSQAISPRDAAELPESVTGGGNYGTEPGTQLVPVRIYGPVGGTIDDLTLEGAEVEAVEKGDVEIDDRPVVTIPVFIDTREDVVLTWSMETGSGQTGDGLLGMTPGILPGNNDAQFPSAC